MIRHTVAFRLKYDPDMPAETAFLADGKRILSAIPGVRKFEVLRQVSIKNDYKFGFSMEFANQAAYDAYDKHPDHVAFVRDRWQKEVVAFLELDYQKI
ncbi:MAG TPA: Dabb family protein [Bauldia sp.]|nr:Dabb family protein [Bauldia sp.]